MDTNVNVGFIAYIKAKHIFVEIAKDIEIWFDTSNYELDKRLPREKNKN